MVESNGLQVVAANSALRSGFRRRAVVLAAGGWAVAALLIALAASTAAAAPLPIAAYSFDEGSGSTLGDSAGENDGTIEGATWASSGKHGAALDFDGSDDSVVVPDAAALDLTDSLTIEAWVKPGEAEGGGGVLVKGENSSGNSGYMIHSKFFGKPAGIVADSGSFRSASGAEALQLETWTHLAFTSDGTDLRFYVDGELAETESAIDAAATEADLVIGHNPVLGGYFTGLIDEVRLYDQALSQSEVEADRDNRVAPPAPTEVTVTSLDSGPESEQVSSLPITDPEAEAEEEVVYSLEVPALTEGEVLRATANLELTNDQSYATTDSVALVLGESESDAEGDVVVPWSSYAHDPEVRHRTFPISGAYRAAEDVGTRYLKVIAKAQAPGAGESDTLTVQQNLGRLSAVRSTPVPSPMSQVTHRLQPQIDPLPELTDTIPVDAIWHRVMTRRVDPLSYEDILDLASQLDVRSDGEATVRVESKITMTATPSTAGSFAVTPVVEQLSPDAPTARIVHANQLNVTDPAKRYFNLSLKAETVSGSPEPLSVAVGATTLEILRHEPSSGEPSAPLGEGTLVERRADLSPDVSSVPYAEPGGSEKRVVASAPLYGGVWKDEILHARGLVTGDMNGTGETTQVLTRLILADSPTDTEGVTIGAFSGDKVPPSTQVHTSVKEGLYAMPTAEPVIKYVNFVVYASQAEPSGSMDVETANVYVKRSKPTAPFDEGFEDGLDTDGIDSVFENEYNGTLGASTAQAREGEKSMLVEIDPSQDSHPDDGPGNRRVEARVPNIRTSGGYFGEETWNGFSVYFPDEFKVAKDEPADNYFDGLIDEVRLYDEALSEGQIGKDLEGSYEETPAPVAAYGFEEGIGSSAGDATGEHDGAVEGATWSEAGKIGSALEFDGVDDAVGVPDDAELDLSEEFTFEAWVRPDTHGFVSPVLSKYDPNSAVGYLLTTWFLGGPAGRVSSSSGSKSAEGEFTLPKEEWSHLAFTSDGTNLKLYVDGELQGTSSAVSAPTTGVDLKIGANPGVEAVKPAQWNVVLQFHLTKDEEIGCPTDTLIGVPANFGVEYFEAGEHTNPGEAETATPEAGEYLTSTFKGGEINSNCVGTVEPGEKFVLGPLERERWYDVVMHINWTLEEGEAGDSVSEVWLDGEKVLGNGATPVLKSSIFWLEDEENHYNATTLQFGNYRGPWAEDPPSQLYYDAVRRGNSYEEVAPRGTTLCETAEAVCPGGDQYAAETALEANSAEAVLTLTFGPSSAKMTCTESTLEAQTEAQSGTPLALALSGLSFGGCEATGTSCAVSATNLPYAGSLLWSGNDDGTLSLADSGEDQPGIYVQCPEATFPVDCTYGFEPELDLQGGEAATIVASEEPMSEAGEKCPGKEPRFTASYTVDEPGPVYVALTE